MSQKRLQKGVLSDDRSVSPVVATILMVAVVIVIAASIGAVTFGITDELGGTSVAASDDQCLQSVDFDPNDVDSFADGATANLDCQLWFDATQESFSDNEEVDRWTDRSGNGLDATSSNEPFISNPEFQTDVDGVDAVRFDSTGDDDGLTTEGTASVVGIDGDQPFTASKVVRPDTDGDGAVLQFGTTGGDFNAFSTQPDMASDQWLFQAIGADFSQVRYDGAGDDEQWFVKTYVYDGDDLEIYKNGESIDDDILGKEGSEEINFNISDTPINIGHFNFEPGNDEDAGFDGAIAEIIFMDEAFGETDRNVLECTLDEKHGSAVSVVGC